MSIRTIHRVTADSAVQPEHPTQPSISFRASNMNDAPPLGYFSAVLHDQHHRDMLPANSVIIPTASMKRKMKDSDRPGVPTGTTVCARSLFNRLYQERMGREDLEEDFPIYSTMTNSIKDEIRSFLYHRLRIERGTRTYSSVKNEFATQISNLKRRLSETYPVLAVAQGGWVCNDFLKEAIQRDKKAASEAAKRKAGKRATRPTETPAEPDGGQDEVRRIIEGHQLPSRMEPVQNEDYVHEAAENDTNCFSQDDTGPEEIKPPGVENEDDEIHGAASEHCIANECEFEDDENNKHNGEGPADIRRTDDCVDYVGLDEGSEDDLEEDMDDGVVDDADPPVKAGASAQRKTLPRSQICRDVEKEKSSALQGIGVPNRASNQYNLAKKQPKSLVRRTFTPGAKRPPIQPVSGLRAPRHGVKKSKNYGSKSRRGGRKNTRIARGQRGRTHGPQS